jgi:hypothetical protein
MHVAILSHPPDFSAYVSEIFRTWGLVLHEILPASDAAVLDPAEFPVVVCPAMTLDAALERRLVAYAERGGTLFAILPEGKLAEVAGVAPIGALKEPLRLCVSDAPPVGLAGELIPVTGRAREMARTPDTRALAFLSRPGRYEGESVAVTTRSLGSGRIVAFAFDLPLCVMRLRQGDPSRAERLPSNDPCARPSHLAVDLGPGVPGWTPYADLLARLLVEWVREALPLPAPLLSHLPGAAAGLLLYSGDEDWAPVAANDSELDVVAAAGARMSLYIIPERTHSTPEDAKRYLERHDLGPHPDLRALDGCPVSERVAEFERQVRLFESRFGVRARSSRNHCTAWAGYLELPESMERLGLRMEGNYLSGTYLRDREPAPYAAFGAAMPMRFGREDGRLIDLYQQHTHLSDDVLFGEAEYSYRLSPRQFSEVSSRIFEDISHRFHTPYAVCIHPGNWVKFSRPQGEELLHQAAAHEMPTWSFDQWLAFQEARERWRLHALSWDRQTLRFHAEGPAARPDLGILLPMTYREWRLTGLHLDGAPASWQRISRSKAPVALLPLPAGATSVNATARYEKESPG